MGLSDLRLRNQRYDNTVGLRGRGGGDDGIV
jgi:hypothetical protein